MARILIIDDDPAIRALLSGILEAGGHSVVTARDGQAGLTAFDGEQVDLIVCDIVMPEQEGIATISAIRRASATVPILAISGSSTVGRYGSHLDAAALMGANATLPKPLTADAFLEAVERLLAARH
ncbi:response regulator [Aliidongia dinghuensis]|uniref:Response regulator n=1 Tax=Aliidongia dinghuensis TaxID=1867774 RepID=A0A8J2YQM8_9PROT|nr:response regulator [Aliidongia dinghuensis]GGF05673.1 response regulator [Aliidongia dinghuensis]